MKNENNGVECAAVAIATVSEHVVCTARGVYVMLF